MPSITNYHWDPLDDSVLLETDQHANTVVTYTHEPGQFGPLLSETRSAADFFHHYDALGSTTVLTTQSGVITDAFAYDAWGTSLTRTGTTPTPYQWIGRWGCRLQTSFNNVDVTMFRNAPLEFRQMSKREDFCLEKLSMQAARGDLL